MNFRSITILFTAILLAGCASSIKVSDWQHSQHGIVNAKHPAFSKDVEECGQIAYADGIMIKGVQSTSRKAAIDHFVDTMLEDFNKHRHSGAYAMAGVEGALAVSTGKPPAYRPPQTPTSSLEPNFRKRYDTLEKKTWDCVGARGWTKKSDAG